METRKYLFETKFKQFLAEQSELRIGAAEIRNPKMQGTSVEFFTKDMDLDTRRDSGPLHAHGGDIIIRVNNLVKQADGSYIIKSKNDIELPNYAAETNYRNLKEMLKAIDKIKDRLFYRFIGSYATSARYPH